MPTEGVESSGCQCPQRQWQNSHPDRFAALRDGLIAQALNREPIARGTELAAPWRQDGGFEHCLLIFFGGMNFPKKVACF